MRTTTFHTMTIAFRAAFLYLALISFIENASAQSKSTTSPINPAVPDAKNFARQYLTRREWKQYEWDYPLILRKNDSSSPWAILVVHKQPKNNELVYAIAHCRENQFVELVRHVVVFKDTNTKVLPRWITSTSFLCVSQADREIKPSKRDSTLYSNSDCRNCPPEVCVTIRGVYGDGKIEKVPQAIYYLVQGAFTELPAACAAIFARKEDWLPGWGIMLDPLRYSDSK